MGDLMGRLEIDIKDGVGWVYISNESRRNAIDNGIMEDFQPVLNSLKNNQEVKVVVITGKGDQSFCSGGDLSVFHKLHTEDEAYSMLSRMAENLYQLFTFPKPTIALLNGAAVGGGCEIAAACDMRVALENSKMGFIQGRLGITTGWGGSTFLFERLPKNFSLYLLASSEIKTAEQAKEDGFIQEIFAVTSWREQFNAWLNPIIDKSLPVLEAYKARLLDTYDLDLIRKRVDHEVRHCAKLWESDEHHAQVQSFLNK